MSIRLLGAVFLVPLGLMAQRPAPAPRSAGTAKPVPSKIASKPIPSAEAPSLKMPSVTGFALANGMRVWLAPDSELPAVSGKLTIGAGSVYDPEGNAGLARLTADLVVGGGSNRRSPQEARRYLAERAAELKAHVNTETATFTFWSLSDHAVDLLQFLAEQTAGPAFDRATLFTARDALRRAVEHRNDVITDVASREFLHAAFGPAIAAPVELAGVTRMQREDVVDFHRRTYRPETAQLTVSGDFDPVAMRSLLERTFGAWKPPQAPAPTRRAVVLPREASVRSATTSNTAAAAFEIGYPLENPSLDDHAALAVFAQILNGPPLETIRKPTEPRAPVTVESLGADARTLEAPPSFRVAGVAKLRDTVESVRDTLAAIDKVLAGGVTLAEFNAARTRTLQRFQSDFDKPAAVVALYGVAPAGWGAPAEFVPKLGEKIAAMSLDECLRAARRLLVPTRRVASVAGETPDFRSPFEILKLPVSVADMTIAPAPPEGAPTPEQIARGTQLWQRMRAALGVDRRPIRDGEIQARGVYFTGRSDRLEQRIQWLAPSTLRVDQKADRDSIAYYDGSTSWYYDGFRAAPFSAAGVRQYRGEIFRFIYWLAARNLAAPLAVHDLGSSVMRVTDGTDSVDIALNENTGLPEALFYIDANGGQRAEERMFDYKDFGGVPYWTRLELYRDGYVVGELDTVSARFNVGLSATEISRRPDQK